MNESYNRIPDNSKTVCQSLIDAAERPVPTGIPDVIRTGISPDDTIRIADGHVQKASVIYPALLKELIDTVSHNKYARAVVSVCGGSGVGKSGVAHVLSYMLGSVGIKSLVMSGDHYPRRFPALNDSERLAVFREGGVRALAESRTASADDRKLLQKWQENGTDADPVHQDEAEWFKTYLSGGTDALKGYLGTDRELRFEEADQTLSAFLDGADRLCFRRLGRDDHSLWYDAADLSDIHVLILEWTHGLSPFLTHIDIPILLQSTPEETLKNRLRRNRDDNIDSPFTALVLSLEQELITSSACRAKITVANNAVV
ncbi:MAG: adenylylsulfate kinase [Lachnospiraceae bacterium]|nr:adenylylsulfate kinase [Lachnospiraceae bacterium]